jgi:hypothetical protein
MGRANQRIMPRAMFGGLLRTPCNFPIMLSYALARIDGKSYIAMPFAFVFQHIDKTFLIVRINFGIGVFAPPFAALLMSFPFSLVQVFVFFSRSTRHIGCTSYSLFPYINKKVYCEKKMGNSSSHNNTKSTPAAAAKKAGGAGAPALPKHQNHIQSSFVAANNNVQPTMAKPAPTGYDPISKTWNPHRLPPQYDGF